MPPADQALSAADSPSSPRAFTFLLRLLQKQARYRLHHGRDASERCAQKGSAPPRASRLWCLRWGIGWSIR